MGRGVGADGKEKTGNDLEGMGDRKGIMERGMWKGV
jgi:hypothetical protein